MIFLDPDLDSDPVPNATQTKHSAVPGPDRSARSNKVPSARTLARFLVQAQTEIRLHGRVSVLLTTDREIRRLNRRFRGIDKPTDVLSFPAEAFIQNKEKIAGDLAISVPTARRQGIEHGHSLGMELKVLMLHGLLHLAGYDHETDNGQMARREQRLRADLGLPHGLIERAGTTRRRATSSSRSRRNETGRRTGATA